MFIENIIYINLDYRTDRLNEIEQEMDKLKNYYPFTVERFSAIQKEPGIIGCGYSHLKSIKYAKECGYPYVWIIEDDFTFTENIETVMETLSKIDDLIVYKKEHLDVIFLAYYLIEGQPYIGNDGLEIDYLIKTTNCQTASSYIINANYYDTLISNLEEGLRLLEESNGMAHYLYANDQYWKLLQKRDNWVCVKSRFGKQRASYSDNSKCFMDYDV
jgi:GR25 family glycosyltransferase involved in LPS biosynthesis